MNLTPEQIAAAQKANLETLSGLTNQALQSIEKLVELNMHIAKQSLSDSMNSAKKALEIKEAGRPVCDLPALREARVFPRVLPPDKKPGDQQQL